MTTQPHHSAYHHCVALFTLSAKFSNQARSLLGLHLAISFLKIPNQTPFS
ncbi:MAG: hypothetical protein ACKVJE_09330 [Pseudomonadales bacterium]